MNRIIRTIFIFWEFTFSIILFALSPTVLKKGKAAMLFNKRFSKRSIGLLWALFVFINMGISKEIVPVNFRIATTSTSTVTIGQPSATGTINITPPTGSFTDLAINDVLTFGYDQNSPIYLATGTDVKIKVLVQQWDVNNTALATFSKTLSVKYHPNDTTQYQDKSIYLFHNAYKYQVSIDSIYVNGVSKADLPQNFFLEMEIAGQRYCDFSTTSSTQIPFTLDTLDLDCDNIMDQILVSWSPISGAEQYQLEWTYINDYGTTLTGFLSPSNVYYDFRNNATRISTVNTYYNVSNIFEHGYVLFRLRGIGNDLTNGSLITGVWNTSLDNGPVSGYNGNIHIVLEHEVNKNWQITSSFAEEGKKKEVVSYFDGSLRNRQTVTQMSSDSTTLVGQTIYDYQGRAAVTVLPSPVTPSCSTAIESSIKYYPKFNRSGWHSFNEYSRSDFDSLSSGNTCVAPTDSMSSLSGTSNYYSPKNPNQKGFQAYLPDAKDFPFSQVEYTPDNTGRIRRQSGVGPQHQLGSNHETKYFYGQPNQLELDRMFASEVGDAAHYKKNIVIDANGQSSITYINLEGKTIATALAGDTSLYTISVNSGRQKPDTLDVDLFAKDANGVSNLNTINVQQNGIEFNTQLLVAYTSNYKFDYTLRIDTLDDPCLDSNICFNCVYDLNIELLDECGHNYALDSNSHIINKHVGKFSINDTTGKLQFNVACSGGSLYTNQENFTSLLNPGNYSLIKTLTVNNDALNFYVNAYLDTLNNKCFKSLNYFQQQALASVDTLNCYITCDACVTSLGSRDSFVAAGKGTALKYDFLYKQCTDPCKPVSPCETSFQMMLADMSPTGQYGLYDSSNFSANAYPLSIFNDSTSKLPNGSSIPHNWHYPQITLNGNTYNHYVNEYGDISTVGITLDTLGKYYPRVIDTTLIFLDTTGGFYTFPENLLNLKDFIANWQPEWANSLVQYHPEYCYYKTCIQYETPDSSHDVYTSEGFDQLLQRTNTFHDAASIMLINTSQNGVTDWTTFSSGPMSHPYDPVVVYNSHYNGIGGELVSKVNNYQTANGQTYSMIEMASYSARCGSLIGVAPTPSCFAFGSNFNTSSPTDPINDSIRNKEWRMLKNFYFSTKQQLINKRYDSLAIHDCPAYNACIGDVGFDKSSNNFYNVSSGYPNVNQPCGSSTYALYATKNRRFVTTTYGSSMPSNANQAAAQLYTYNHQCPITTSFQNFLSTLAAEDSLTKSFSLLHTDAYASLYLATQGAFDPTPPAVYPPITDSYYKWVVLDTGASSGTSAQQNTMHVQLVNPVTNYSCSLTIDKTGAGNVYWKEIKGFDSLFPSSSNPAVTQTFNLQAKLSYTNTLGGDSSVYKHITGTLGNCFNIVSCNFNTSSSPTTFASDLNLLMTSLANNHDLTNNNVHLEIPLYTPLLTPTIRNEVGTPNTNLYWNYDNTQNVFTLYDASNPLCNLNIAIQTPYPTLTQLQSITSFQDIGTYNNSISSSQINGYDVNNNLVTSLIITATHSCGGITTGAPMNSNLPPVPVTCNGSQYQATNQLVPLIEDLLINQFVPTSTINIVGSPYFTPLLQSYFPNASSASFTYNNYQALQAVGSGDEHVFINEQFDSLKISMPGCDLDLFTHPHTNSQFSLQHLYNINAFGYIGLTLTGPVDANGNYHAFYMPVVYGVDVVNNTAGCVSDTTIKYLNDTIFGTTCLPLQICNTVCNNGVAASNGLIQYNNGAGACTDSNPVSPPDVFITPPTSQDPCVQQLLQAANAAAQNAYSQYVDSLTTYIATKYLNHCLHPLENFYERYLDKQYHYTLYYYDQAGNLVKTIPPEGVNLLPIDSSANALEKKIISDRTNKTQSVFTAHVLQTNYEYNSLNQLTRQYMPDHDKMDVFETTLPNGLNSQLVVTGSQFIGSGKGYLSGYVDIGSGLKRGYNYVSNDGGQTWLRLTGLVASDLHKVQMVDAYRGYAVGNEGTIVRTVDGGQNWDMLNTFSTNITSQFTGLYFTDSLHGVFIGDKQNIIATTDGGLTFSSGITATPPFVSTDSLTSITHDGSSYILALLRRGATGIPDYSIIYSSTNGTTWSEDSINTGNLHDVCLYNNTSGNPEAYGVGDNGVLLHKNYGDNNWYMVPAGIANAFRYVYFINVNEGIALIDSVPGYAQIYRTSNAGISWTRLSNKGEYYNQITPYETTAGGAKLMGVGKKGLVSRIILYSNTPFGIITLNFPDHSKNLTACWATDFTSGTQVPVWALVGDDAGLLYYTYNASNSTVSWNNNLPVTPASIITYTNSSNPTPTPISSGIKQIEAIQDTVTSPGHGRVISAQILTADGSVYYLFKPYNSVTTFSTNLVSPTSVAFDKMTFDPINRVVYAYSNSSQKLDTATLKTNNYTSYLSSLVNGTSDMTSINSITYNSNKIIVAVGNEGIIKYLDLHPSTPHWFDQTNKIIPLQLNAVAYNAYTPKKAYAVGNNGLLLKRYANKQWKVLSNGLVKQLNTIGFTSAATGLIAGNQGKLYEYSIISGTDTTVTTLPVTITTNNNLHEIALNGTQAYISGANGTLLYTNNLLTSGTVFNVIPTTLTNKLNSVSFIPASGGNAIAVGDRSTVNLLAGTTRVNIKNVFTAALRSINSADGVELYTVGDNYTIRHSVDGGISWSVLLPSSGTVSGFNFTKVKVKNSGIAYVTGNHNYFGKTGSNNFISPVTLGGSNNIVGGTAFGSSGNVTLNDICINSNGIVYMVGEDGTSGISIYYNESNGKWAYLAANGTLPSPLKAMWLFTNNAMMTCGASGYVGYFMGNMPTGNSTISFTTGVSFAPPTYSLTTFNTIYFHDDYTGYLGGKGVLLKSENTAVNLSTYLISGINWQPLDITDSLQGQTNADSMQLNTLSFSSRYYGFMGGNYQNKIQPAVQTGYARVIHDESFYFSTRFWYDRLGRLTLSQNTKQFNKQPKALSYTTYDALGRITEVGELAMNNHTYNLPSVFGDYINDYYNPLVINDTSLSSFIAHNLRTEVTHTYYDTLAIDSLPGNFVQNNLRKRVSSVTYEDLYDNNPQTFNHATHYSYDVHGNVTALLQDNHHLASIGQRFKRTDYDYDIVSGKVNDVHYQNGQPDAFHHHMEYDADNRVTEVYTSRFPTAQWSGYKDAFWDRDAKYYYYQHGPMARVEIGDNNLQGIDYAYNIQGWIKGVNSEALQPGRDIGKDGLYASANPNKTFAKDAFGYSLTYYDGDYDAIYKGWKADSTNRFTASQYTASHAVSDLSNHRYNLYNANVSAMVSSITNPGVNTSMPLASSYRYDQLNRIVQSQSFQELQGVTNNWNNENTANSSLSKSYYNTFSYDANGNILSQLRKDVNGTNIDSLIYNYAHDSNNELFQNRLYSVNDNVPISRFKDDIDDQGTFHDTLENINIDNNYSYDELGQLKKDSAEEIQNITWTVYNKIKSISRYPGSIKQNLSFDYDASGNRVAKHIYTSANVWIRSIFYVRDAEGRIMTTYEEKSNGSSLSYRIKEHDMFGSNRLGTVIDSLQLIGANPDTVNYSRVLGQKNYEMTNHIGNVITVVSDRKIAVDPASPLSLYNSPSLVRTTIDSLGGMKMQPLQQNGGVNFAFKSAIGQNYQIDFYVNLGNTDNADQLQFDYPSSSGNSLSSTGHYTYSFSATDTLSNFIPYYAATAGVPNHYFLFDSLKVLATGITLDSIKGYNTQIVSISDYYPFGAPLNGRTWSLNRSYTYGFNNQEKDDEVFGAGNEIDYEKRIYDPRLGRFLSPDPRASEYPMLSTYQFASNTPIQAIDVDGEEGLLGAVVGFASELIKETIAIVRDNKKDHQPNPFHHFFRKLDYVDIVSSTVGGYLGLHFVGNLIASAINLEFDVIPDKSTDKRNKIGLKVAFGGKLFSKLFKKVKTKDEFKKASDDVIKDAMTSGVDAIFDVGLLKGAEGKVSLGDKITSFTKDGSPANTVAGGAKDDAIGIPSDIGADKIMDKINEAKVKRVDDFYQDPNKLVDEFFDRKGQTKKEQKKDLKKTKKAVKRATSKPSF